MPADAATTSTTDAATSGLADVFDDGGAPNPWATTTAADLGGGSATGDVVPPGPKQLPTEEAEAATTDAMGGDVMGTAAVESAMSTPTDPLILTAPAGGGDAEPTNTGIVPPWLQTPAPDGADDPMNTGIVPPAIDTDEPVPDPVDMPDEHDRHDSMDDAPAEPDMDTLADPLGV